MSLTRPQTNADPLLLIGCYLPMTLQSDMTKPATLYPRGRLFSMGIMEKRRPRRLNNAAAFVFCFFFNG